MLNKLFIKNMAVIESAEIEFSKGFNILTGETGAGKSIVIDSLNILKGERVGKDVIRSGETKARVDGVFTIDRKTAEALEDEFGIETEDGELIISREINAEGKGNVRINGLPTTVAVLKEVGQSLINIHGQHDNTSLLHKKTHISLLDSVAGEELGKAYDSYINVHRLFRQKSEELAGVSTDEQEKSYRLEMLNFRIDEIENANLFAGEDEELAERRKFLENAVKIAERTGEAYSALYEGDDVQKPVNDLLWESLNKLEDVLEYDERIKKLHTEITDIAYELSDKIHSLKKYIDTLSCDPVELEQVEDRLDLIYNLKKKYGATTELVLKYLADAKKEADGIVRSDELAAELAAETERLSKERCELARVLTSLRVEAGKKLSEEVEQQLKDLDMPKTRFSVKTEPAEFSGSGADDIEFLICTNVGEEFKPLTKIASGGELSRIMLAIKSVLTGGDVSKTLVFDEIDSGVSGKAAQKIGEKLRAVSCGSQIICVTHLPQIAALADAHYLIEKSVCDGRTVTSVKHLSREERVYELARTLGGATVTDITLANAGELLNQAGN